MNILPAIDLLSGSVVRLFKGAYDTAKTYNTDPAEAALLFADSGAKIIHLVDLDAAKGQGKNNRPALKVIRESVDCVLEVGGGIRTEEDIKELLDLGIERLVLGTVFVKNPGQAARWIKQFGKHFIAGIDALDGTVRISGWESDSSLADTELAKKAAQIGISGIIYTNIAKDGTLQGPDLERTNLIAEVSGLPIVLSGGISSEADVDSAVRNGHKNLWGIIIGKAYYEGRLDIRQVISKYQGESIHG